MENDKDKDLRKEIESLKSSIAQIGYQVEETEEGELRVSEK